MNNRNSLNLAGQLRLMGDRGYSAYEVAQQNGYTGTEEEWLASLVGPQGPQGIQGKSAYQVAVDNGYVGTESDFVNDFLTPEGYYNKATIDKKLEVYTIDEITTEKFLYAETNTHYFVTHIPHLDSEGNIIKIKHGLALDNATTSLACDETVRSFAKRNNASVCINASIWGVDPNEENYNKPVGPIIKDGQFIVSNGTAGYTPQTAQTIEILGVKDDNTLKVYPLTTTVQQLLDDGVVNTFVAFNQHIKDGEITTTNNTDKYQYNYIGQNTTTKDIYLICCNGKDINNEEGMTPVQLMTILKNTYNCDFAYRLDQGGSTSLVVDSILVNQPTDDTGRTERKVCDFLYFSKAKATEIDDRINDLYNNIGDVKAIANDALEKVRYLNSIVSNRIDFRENENISTGSGMTLAYIKNNSRLCSLIMSPDGNPKTLNLYDNENNETLLRLNGITGEIYTSAGTLATIFKNNNEVTDLNNAIDTGVYKASSNTLNTPDATYQWVVVSLRIHLSGAIQIAIPMRQNQSLTSWKVRHYASNEFGDWYNLVTPTSTT